MRRIASLILALVLMLTVIPVNVQAAEIDGEDPVLDYGTFGFDIGSQSVGLMGVSDQQLFRMADIPKGGKYKTMSASQKIVDVIKDFEGFRSKAYWDNSQWTVGYGTKCSGSHVTVTRAEAERMLMKVLDSTYEPIVNNFCKENGKQPTQQQFDALLDLTYNVGGNWSTGSAVPDVVLKPSTALDIVKGLGAWSRSGGGVSYVHVNRRIREALIYLYGEYYLAYGGQDCKSNLKVVDNDNLPRFKAVIFKTKSGKLSNGKTDYAAYYPVGDYYRAFVDGSRSGYTLVGWKITKISNDSVSSGKQLSVWDKVNKNLELTAEWKKGTFTVAPEKPPADYQETNYLPFTDVAKNAWFREAVSFVYNNGLMEGIEQTVFSPNSSMTRGMLVTVLHRMSGSVAVSSKDRQTFKDVASSAYYADAVAWAYSNGIVYGVGDNTFAPNEVVTRQDAIVIFHRYLMGTGAAGAGSGANLNGFADRTKVAGYATEAFSWAVATGLVAGSADNGKLYLNPNKGLSRCEAAVLLQRCVEDIM